MPLEPLAVEKIDFGAAITMFKGAFLSRTKGETQFNYSIETYKAETEEDGTIDEIITDDPLLITVPCIYSDVDTLSVLIPWAILVTDPGTGAKKLEVGKAIGTRLKQFADELIIHPISKADADKSKDLTVYKCYPKPGPLNFAYARTGERIANVQFIAIRDESKTAGKDYFCIGDKSIAGDATAPTVLSSTPAAAATGVAKASGFNIDFVMSEALDPKMVVKANTVIVKTSDMSLFTDYTVSYLPETKTIRLTTTAALTASTEYAVVLCTGITDANKNPLAAPYTLQFTTGV